MQIYKQIIEKQNLNKFLDFCKDSSDSSYDEEEEIIDVEYEVASTTDTDSEFDGSSSGTDVNLKLNKLKRLL